MYIYIVTEDSAAGRIFLQLMTEHYLSAAKISVIGTKSIAKYQSEVKSDKSQRVKVGGCNVYWKQE